MAPSALVYAKFLWQARTVRSVQNVQKKARNTSFWPVFFLNLPAAQKIDLVELKKVDEISKIF